MLRSWRRAWVLWTVAWIGVFTPGSLAHAEPAPVALGHVEGLGPILLFGDDPRDAANQLVEGMKRRGAYPGHRQALEAWAKRQPVAEGDAQRFFAGGRPIIGVQLNRAEDLLGGAQVSPRTRNIVKGLRDAGGVVLLLPPASDGRRTRTVLKHIDSLVLLGGDDIHPSLYGQRVTHAIGLDRVRDLYEHRLTRTAIELGTRVVGICRGAQNLVIATGGSLYQDIHAQGVTRAPHGQVRNGRAVVAKHPVALLRGSHAARTFGTKRLAAVNSVHHQSIRRLGSGLRISGVAPDGMPELIESRDDRVRGYQFHPEMDPVQLRKMTRDIVAKAGKRSVARRVRRASMAQRRTASRPSVRPSRHRALRPVKKVRTRAAR